MKVFKKIDSTSIIHYRDLVVTDGKTIILHPQEDWEEEETWDSCEKFLSDPDPEVRIFLAKHSWGLDRLISDPDPRVREEVALKGVGSEILSKDPNPWVRAAALCNATARALSRDPEPLVRMRVALSGYYPRRLGRDPEASVRAAVAMTTQDPRVLKRLVKDKKKRVKKALKAR